MARLLRRGPPRFLLFVCHGNICRSPYAAKALERLLGDGSGVRVESAGFVGPGRSAPPEGVTVGAARGVDLSRHRAKLLGPPDVLTADLVVVMDPWQRRAVSALYGRDERDIVVLGDLDPGPIETRAILDPVEQPASAFEASYERIDRCLKELVRATRGDAARG